MASRNHRRKWAAVAAVVAVAAAGATAAAGAPGGNVNGVCGTLRAKGKTYQVRTINVPCKAGRPIIAKLAAMPDPGKNKPYPGVYLGMHCAHLARGGESIWCANTGALKQVVGVLKR